MAVFDDDLRTEPAAKTLGDSQLSPEVFLEAPPCELLNTRAAYFVEDIFFLFKFSLVH